MAEICIVIFRGHPILYNVQTKKYRISGRTGTYSSVEEAKTAIAKLGWTI